MLLCLFICLEITQMYVFMQWLTLPRSSRKFQSQFLSKIDNVWHLTTDRFILRTPTCLVSMKSAEFPLSRQREATLVGLIRLNEQGHFGRLHLHIRSGFYELANPVAGFPPTILCGLETKWLLRRAFSTSHSVLFQFISYKFIYRTIYSCESV